VTVGQGSGWRRIFGGNPLFYVLCISEN